MKKLITILALACVFSASAGLGDLFRYDKPTADDSWKKLSQDRQLKRVMFLFPQYALSYGYFAWGTSVCVDGDTIKLNKSVKKCVRRVNNDDDNRECLEYKTVRPSTPISGTRLRCAEREDGNCIRYERVSYTYETEMMIPVHKHTNSDNGGWTNRNNFGRKLFEKYFAVPQCN